MDTTSSRFYSTNTSKPIGETVGLGVATSHRRSREMANLSLEITKYPRDLLQTFLGTNPSFSSTAIKTTLDDTNLGAADVDEDDGGLNLGLGLSLGGKFGVDKSHSHKGLIRSSSIVGTMPLLREDHKVAPPAPAPVHTLVRTSSLPVETEEEWRKRKEMQTLRRMEAKRRRSQKQRIFRETGGPAAAAEDKALENLNFRERLEREQQYLGITNKLGAGGGSGSGSSAPPTPNVELKRRTTFGSLQGFLMAQAHLQSQPQAQGSGESQAGSSSGASEQESRTHHGSSIGGEAARSPSSIHSIQERGSEDSGSKDESAQAASAPEADGSTKPPDVDSKKKREASSGGIEDMPCVFTIGDGPHGRKVEGILYRYGKGEEVGIMCVCHGSFFSPAEFVKHAGGRDVEHPLRHIVVSPSVSPFQ